MTLIAARGTHYIIREPLAVLPMPQPKGPRRFVHPFIEDVETVLDNLGCGEVLNASAITYGIVIAPPPEHHETLHLPVP